MLSGNFPTGIALNVVTVPGIAVRVFGTTCVTLDTWGSVVNMTKLIRMSDTGISFWRLARFWYAKF